MLTNWAKPADQANGSRGAERGQVVLIHLVAQPGVAELVQAGELVQAVGAAVGHEQAMEGDRQAGLAERLHRLRLAEQARAGGDQDDASAVRVERVGHEAVDGRDPAALQAGS